MKCSIQQLHMGNTIDVHASPIRKPPTARPANLIRKESKAALLDSVVMRFDNPVLVEVGKPDHESVLNRGSEQRINASLYSLQAGYPLPVACFDAVRRLMLEAWN
jgi:hypothetical protein